MTLLYELYAEYLMYIAEKTSRRYFNLPHLDDVFVRRKQSFMDQLIGLGAF